MQQKFLSKMQFKKTFAYPHQGKASCLLNMHQNIFSICNWKRHLHIYTNESLMFVKILKNILVLKSSKNVMFAKYVGWLFWERSLNYNNDLCLIKWDELCISFSHLKIKICGHSDVYFTKSLNPEENLFKSDSIYINSVGSRKKLWLL
ncbi:UNVERIFIED_CONTAM: hypothetical protein NCL1_63342 [Trichonephila clavipes]